MSRSDGHVPRIVHAGGHEGAGDFPDHRHEHAWELLYLYEGNIMQRSGGEAVMMTPGTFIVHPPGTVHGDSATSRYFLYHVLVTSEKPLEWPRLGTDLEGAPICALLDMVVQEWCHNRLHREAFIRHCASLLDVLMKRCAIRDEESGVAIRTVSAACGLFRREFPRSIDMKAVASDLNISRSTLYAYFHQVLERTPQEVLDGIRLKHAVCLLKHSDLSMERVAKDSGYCSASHLGRKLRATYSLTAGQIRRSCTHQEPLRSNVQ
jgi:AraC-like DNA-binding protein